MDTKLLTDFFETLPSASQIDEVKQELDELKSQNEELKDQIELLSGQIADIRKSLEEFAKVMCNETALIKGLVKMVPERPEAKASEELEDLEDLDNLEDPEEEEAEEPEAPIAEVQTPVQTLADSIHTEESLADKLQKTVEHETVASALNSSHIESIKSAITIADRFRFQRELFGSNGALMSATVDELDSFTTMAEAEAYIARHFQWNDENETVRDFMAIVARRY